MLILESPDDKRHLARLQAIVEYYRLPVSIMPLYGFIPSAFEPKKMEPPWLKSPPVPTDEGARS